MLVAGKWLVSDGRVGKGKDMIGQGCMEAAGKSCLLGSLMLLLLQHYLLLLL